MTQATLPVLGELQKWKTFVVKLDDGSVLNAEIRNGYIVTKVSGFTMTWNVCGVGFIDSNREIPPRIVAVLGPSEETHGDMVTQLMTVRVTAAPGRHERITGFRIRDTRGEFPQTDGTSVITMVEATLSPKPTPLPTYTERLIEAVKKGECRLPLKATLLRYIDNVNGGVWLCENPGERGTWSWPQYALGPLPPWQPGDETSIDLAAVREAAEGKP